MSSLTLCGEYLELVKKNPRNDVVIKINLCMGKAKAVYINLSLFQLYCIVSLLIRDWKIKQIAILKLSISVSQLVMKNVEPGIYVHRFKSHII